MLSPRRWQGILEENSHQMLIEVKMMGKNLWNYLILHARNRIHGVFGSFDQMLHTPVRVFVPIKPNSYGTTKKYITVYKPPPRHTQTHTLQSFSAVKGPKDINRHSCSDPDLHPGQREHFSGSNFLRSKILFTTQSLPSISMDNNGNFWTVLQPRILRNQPF